MPEPRRTLQNLTPPVKTGKKLRQLILYLVVFGLIVGYIWMNRSAIKPEPKAPAMEKAAPAPASFQLDATPALKELQQQRKKTEFPGDAEIPPGKESGE